MLACRTSLLLSLNNTASIVMVSEGCKSFQTSSEIIVKMCSSQGISNSRCLQRAERASILACCISPLLLVNKPASIVIVSEAFRFSLTSSETTLNFCGWVRRNNSLYSESFEISFVPAVLAYPIGFSTSFLMTSSPSQFINARRKFSELKLAGYHPGRLHVCSRWFADFTIHSTALCCDSSLLLERLSTTVVMPWIWIVSIRSTSFRALAVHFLSIQ
jgi:hypothetical protein